MTTAPTSPVLRRGISAFVRGTGKIQVGLDPERRAVITVPETMAASGVIRCLEASRALRTDAARDAHARSAGVDPVWLHGVLSALAESGHAVTEPPSRIPLRIRIHGRGPLTEKLCESLQVNGFSVDVSARRPRASDSEPLPTWTRGLVVLADYLVHDPAVIDGLMRRRLAHLPVRMRDGTGVVGPLVLPGLSSCLRCADLHRADRDPQWGAICAQLLNRSGHGSAAVVATTAAIATETIQQLAGALAEENPAPPQTLDTSIEFTSHPFALRRRSWSPHPVCGCTPVM